MLLWPILFAILPFLGILARWSAPLEALSEAAASIPIGADIDFADVATEEGARHAFAAGPLLWTGIGVALAVLRCAHMCYSCVLASCFQLCLRLMDWRMFLFSTPLFRLNTILIKNAAPSQEALGATFGLAQTVACVARAGSPAFVR